MSRRGKKKNVVKRNNNPPQSASIEINQQEFTGPLPPPSILSDFDAIVPGSAEKIIDQFIAQGQHRMELERHVVTSDTRRANWGLAAGFIVSLVALGGGIYLAYLGRAVEGALLMGADIATLAGVFVYGAEIRRRERQEKASRN